MRFNIHIIFLLSFLVTSSALRAHPMDSLGVEFINGKPFILHRVEAQETLYGLSKRYNASVNAIKNQNQLDGNALSLGTILKIPWPQALTHSIREGETMYTLAKRYGVSIEDLRRWNNLSSNELEINQVLNLGMKIPLTKQPIQNRTMHQVSSNETLYSIARSYEVSVAELQSWNNLRDFGVGIGDTLWLSPTMQPTSLPLSKDTLVVNGQVSANDQPFSNSSTQITAIDPMPKSPKTPVKAVKESGVAAVFEEDDTKKYLALHRTAPVGTIMQVRNEMTNLTVFVRVVGKLPDTGVNNNVLLRLSKAAQRGLGALDGRFRVELSFIPSQ